MFRRERALPHPAKEGNSVDADDAQNFSGGHPLVQGCNSIAVLRDSLDRAFGTPWGVRKFEGQLLWGFDAPPSLRASCTHFDGHVAGCDLSIGKRGAGYSASNATRRVTVGNEVIGALRMLQVTGRRIGVAVSARRSAPSAKYPSVLSIPRDAARCEVGTATVGGWRWRVSPK